MTGKPTAHVIPRRGRVFPAGERKALPTPEWSEITSLLRDGKAGPFWLSVNRGEQSPHVRPVFAAWGDESFFFVSKGSAAKTRRFTDNPNVSVGVDLTAMHVVVEGTVARVTGADRLRFASETLEHVFGWPTEVDGEKLEAEGGAPTSGGPPYEVWELTPTQAYVFATEDQYEPTRWTFTGR